MALIEEVSGLV